LWSLLLWRYSRPTWTRSCAACCRWPCFGRGVELDDPQRSLPTPYHAVILWKGGSTLYFHNSFSFQLCSLSRLDKWFSTRIMPKQFSYTAASSCRNKNEAVVFLISSMSSCFFLLRRLCFYLGWNFSSEFYLTYFCLESTYNYKQKVFTRGLKDYFCHHTAKDPQTQHIF